MILSLKIKRIKRLFGRKLTKDWRIFLLGGLFCLFIFAPFLAPASIFDLLADTPIKPLGRAGTYFFLLGSDALGRDLLTLLLHGLRNSFFILIVGTLTATFLGGGLCVLLLILPRLFSGFLEEILSLWIGFPSFLTLWLLIQLLKHNFGFFSTTIFALCFVYSPYFCRRFYQWYLDFRKTPHFMATTSLGASSFSLFLHHTLPAWSSLFISQILFASSRMLLTLLSLQALGETPPMNIVTLGSLLSQGIKHFTQQPWIFIFSFLFSLFGIFFLYGLGAVFQSPLLSSYDFKKK